MSAERLIFFPGQVLISQYSCSSLYPLNVTLHTLGYIHACSLFDRTHPKVIELVFPPSPTPSPFLLFLSLASLLGSSG